MSVLVGCAASGHHHQPDVLDLARGGASFSLRGASVAGKVTVVDFWSRWCDPCLEIGALLESMAREHSGLAVRRVEVPEPESEVARDYLTDVPGLPHLWILGPDGERVATLTGVEARDVQDALERVLQGS